MILIEKFMHGRGCSVERKLDEKGSKKWSEYTEETIYKS